MTEKNQRHGLTMMPTAILLAILSVSIGVCHKYYSHQETLLAVDAIDRFHENQLDMKTFVDQYAKQGKPVIIIRDATVSNSSSWTSLPSSLKRNCGDDQLSAISLSMRDVLVSLTNFQKKLFGAFLWLVLGVDFTEYVQKRQHVSFHEIEQAASNNENRKKQIPYLAQLFLPSTMKRLLVFFTRPLYLGDAVYTKHQAERCGIPLIPTSQEEQVLAAANGRDQYYRHHATRYIACWLFWGGIDSSNYPLHRDNNDDDVFIDVFEGCKDMVIVNSNQRHLLQKLPIPGAHVWKNDFYQGRPPAITEVWRGTIHKGETLYMPGDFLHEARNRCTNTLSSSRRPWSGRMFRDIVPHEYYD